MIPQANQIYKHFKGNLYKIITIAIHSETMEKMVVYQALYGTFDIYVRPLDMFVSEVDKEKYPDVTQTYRFELLDQMINVAESVQGTTPVKMETVQSVNQEKTEASAEVFQEEAEEEVAQVDPMLMEFMDAYTYEEKLNILVGLHHRITDDMINVMAVVLDIEVEPGDIETRYQAVKNCVMTMEKFECNRLR